ncbi:hypothetical protein R6Q57_021895 [Mikania cordata]
MANIAPNTIRPSNHDTRHYSMLRGEGDENNGQTKRRKMQSSTSIQDEDEDENGLLLTLSLPNPSTQKSSNGSSMSDISEVYSTPNVNDGSLNKGRVNLDLSIALCGLSNVGNENVFTRAIHLNLGLSNRPKQYYYLNEHIATNIHEKTYTRNHSGST